MDLPARLPGFLLVAAACAWLFLFTYNVLICRLDRGVLKTVSKKANLLLFVLAPPTLLVALHERPAVDETLRLAPRTPLAWALVLGAATVLLYALACHVRHLLQRRASSPAALRSDAAERRPFEPRAEDWNAFGAMGRDAAPPPGAPPLRRRLKRIRPHTLEARLALAPPWRAIDQTYDLRVRRMEVAFPNLPPGFDGATLLHLSDLHYGELLSPRWFEHVAAEARRLAPDLVVVTGDFTAGDKLYAEAVEAVASIKAPLGVWAVRGNHDHYTEPERIAWWLERAGVRLLADAVAEIERGGDTLRLAGLERPFNRPPRGTPDPVAAAIEGGPRRFTAAATHTPDNAPRLARAGADLILAGHTHGGQWRLPHVGPLVVPSAHGRRFALGLQQVRNALLHVSPGVGIHTIPLRLFCPPELTLLILRRAAPGQAAASPASS